jgi:serine/threonine protein kinase
MAQDRASPSSSPEKVDDLDATRILHAKDLAAILGDDATVIVNSHAADQIKRAHALAMGFTKTEALDHAPVSSCIPAPTVPAASMKDAVTTTSSLLPKGARVAEFEIVRLIGQGGFGVVYEAWDHALERVVAIKEYMPSSLSTRLPDGNVVPLSERHKDTFDAGMRSFINEARMLAQFDHPALLKVYRFWQDKGTTYMVMPLYQGKTLKEALSERRGKVDQNWLLRIIDGVTQALAVLHESDCYHRDIAPDNIMLLEFSEQPVVLDFGAARRVIKDMTQAITVILKPGYAPIEQYSETPDMKQGPWTDVYALCAVMYAAITDWAPPPAVARMINDRCAPLANDAALLERFSPHILQAVDRGLAVTPDRRLPSMSALREALGLPAVSLFNDSYTQSPATVRSTTSQSNAPAALSKHVSWKLLAGAFSLIVFVAGLGFWLLSPTQQSQTKDREQSAVSSPILPASAVLPPIPTTAPSAVPKSALDSIVSLVSGANPAWKIDAKPSKEEVLIGKDRLSFQIRSSKSGFAYVYLLSSTGDLYLLFPNVIDKRNQIPADTEIQLPRASWAMDAGGPAGINEFAVLVTDQEMDMGTTGFRFDGVFGKFPLNVLAGMESTRGEGKSPLLGMSICPVGSTCSVTYGATRFKITEK